MAAPSPQGPCNAEVASEEDHASAGEGSAECAHDSGGPRWLLTLVQPQRSELAARVVSGAPKGAGKRKWAGLRRLAPVNVHTCGEQRLGKAAGWLGICVAHSSFFSGEAAVFVCRPGHGEPHSRCAPSVNSPCFFFLPCF